MTGTHHIRRFCPYSRRRWLSFDTPTLYGTLASFHPYSTANFGNTTLPYTASAALPHLIYTFATRCLVLILTSVSCSGNRARLIQQQSLDVSVDSDCWLLLLRVACWFLYYYDTFLRTFLKWSWSCCFALILKTCVLVFHFLDYDLQFTD